MCAFGVGKVGEPCRSVSVLSRVGLTASPTELGGGRTQGSPMERGSEQDLCSITQLTATEHSPGAPCRPFYAGIIHAEFHVVGASTNIPSYRRFNSMQRGDATSHATQQVRMRAGRGQASKLASMQPLQGQKKGLEEGDLEESGMRGLETTQACGPGCKAASI